jgi:glycosyltransferase involved in cell wall biosynthesis
VSQVGRVLLVTSELRCGGAERVMVHLASTLRTLDVAVEIVCLQRPGVLAEEARAAGVDVVALQSLRGYDLKAVWSLAKCLRRFRPDVINVHDRSSLPYVIVANWIGGRRPLVFSAHGLLVQDERPRLRDRWAARRLSQVTAVSQPAAQEYARLLGWKGVIEQIDNGVPPVERCEALRRRFRQSLELNDDAFIFAAVGNVKPEKGFEDLLDAAAALRGMAGNRAFNVLIAGGSADEEYRTSLLARSKRLNLNGHARFLGHCADTQSLYSAADAFVLSSRKEGLPMVLLEAMSAGLPVVATEVGAVPEVIRPDVDGLLVPPASADRLARAMCRLATDESLRVSLGSAGRARVENQYGVHRMAERYLDVFARAAARKGTEDVLVGNSRSKRDRPSVLMLGPLPPLTGGMATVACNLRDSDLRRLCDLETINNGKTTAEGRPLLAGVWAQAALLWKILSTIRRGGVGVVHIHTCALFSFWRDTVHALAIRTLGCRVVWHLHDGTFPTFISEGSRFKRAVIRWSLRRAAATIVLSEATLEALRPHAPGVRWRVVPNGVPLGKPRQDDEASDNSPDAPLRMIFLGNLTRRKGAYDLIAAVETAAKQGVRAVLSLAGGETAPGQRTEIERRIAESPCAGQICLLGLVHGEQKQKAFDEADSVVLPSYAEGLPMALLEGMAEGLPAIATRIGSIPALVNDGVEGFLIPAGDIEALAERICRLARDPALRRRMGRNARDRVENEFSQRAMAERVFRIYQAAIAGEADPIDETDLQAEAVRV